MQIAQAIYVHPDERNVLLNRSKFKTAAWITPEEILPKPTEWSADAYEVKTVENNDEQKVISVDEGYTFDLGVKKLRVLHLPGHSPGSIGLLSDDGILVTGDTVYATDEELIDWYPGSSCLQMRESVQRILELKGWI